MAEYEYVGNGNPDGTSFGRDATEPTSFHGVTPVVQAAFVSALATTGSALTVYGYTTTAQANAIVSNLNAIRTLLINKGLMAAS